jgi:hypothetical protein
MASIPPLGPRGYQNTGLGSNLPASTRPAGANELKRTDAGNPVSLSSTGLDLQQRIGALGHATVDLAQNLLNGFAKDMFGDAMEGATIDFDSVSLESASSFAAGVMSSEGADGVFNAAAFSLKDSSHFIGKGTITLADGQKYDFEIEVQYEASLQAGASSSVPSRRKELAEQNPAMPLPAVEFPDIDFPGSLADLFKLFDKPIGGDVKKDEETPTKPTAWPAKAPPCCGAATSRMRASCCRRWRAAPTTRARASAPPAKVPATPTEAFHLHRQAQSQRARTLAMLLIPFEAGYTIPLRRAPDVHWPATKPMAWRRSLRRSLRELLGLIGAHEWRRKGVEIPALDARIHPWYGVFSPVRGEYVELVAQAPLPARLRSPSTSAPAPACCRRAGRRGLKRVIATDMDQRALAARARTSQRLGSRARSN